MPPTEAPGGRKIDEEIVQTALADDWARLIAADSADYFDDFRIEELRPDLFPFDRILGEILIARDQLRGIENPNIQERLTARW